MLSTPTESLCVSSPILSSCMYILYPCVTLKKKNTMREFKNLSKVRKQQSSHLFQVIWLPAFFYAPAVSFSGFPETIAIPTPHG